MSKYDPLTIKLPSQILGLTILSDGSRILSNSLDMIQEGLTIALKEISPSLRLRYKKIIEAQEVLRYHELIRIREELRSAQAEIMLLEGRIQKELLMMRKYVKTPED